MLAALVIAVPTAAAAQSEERPLLLSVSTETGELTVRLSGVLEDGSLSRALHAGLPIRVRVRAELWKDGFFDSQQGEAQWRATVVYEPLSSRYRVETTGREVAEELVETLAAASLSLSRSVRMPLRPGADGRWYYVVNAEVETLSLSDLQELRRWLRGELAPAVAGDENVENAMARGVRRLVVRVLGLPARRYRDRTPSFRVGAEP